MAEFAQDATNVSPLRNALRYCADTTPVNDAPRVLPRKTSQPPTSIAYSCADPGIGRGARYQGAAWDEPFRRPCVTAYGLFGVVLKSTFGVSRAPGVVTSKYSRGLAPVTFAVITAGKLRMYVLYD